MPNFNLPHTFHDGTGETASGAQVSENQQVLKEKIEALENLGSSLYLGSVQKAVPGTYTPATDFPALVGHAALLVISCTFNNNTLGANFFRATTSLIVPAGVAYSLTEPAAGLLQATVGAAGGSIVGPGGGTLKEQPFVAYYKMPFT